MTYTKKQFLEDVKKEAVALKKHATKEELGKLELAILDPGDFRQCLYGLMTGDCRSDRASELIFNSCKRYFHNPNTEIGLNFSVFQEKVNGSAIDGVTNAEELSEKRDWGVEYLSAIESYILLPEAKNANLIDFLKGNRKDLVL